MHWLSNGLMELCIQGVFCSPAALWGPQALSTLAVGGHASLNEVIFAAAAGN